MLASNTVYVISLLKLDHEVCLGESHSISSHHIMSFVRRLRCETPREKGSPGPDPEVMVQTSNQDSITSRGTCSEGLSAKLQGTKFRSLLP
jgi:hypothetical protein